MKKNILVVLILSVVFMGCFSSNNSNTEVNKKDVSQDKVINEEESENLKFIGTYESKTGVMTNISCYCFQTGYFTTEEGNEIVICFKDGTKEASCSDNLRIVGYFKNITITPEETSPCSAGEREIFHVTEYECM